MFEHFISILQERLYRVPKDGLYLIRSQVWAVAVFDGVIIHPALAVVINDTALFLMAAILEMVFATPYKSL